MPTAKTLWDPRRLDWLVVDNILQLFATAWGPGHNTPGEHVAAVAKLREMEEKYPREYVLAKRWFDSPNVKRK